MQTSMSNNRLKVSSLSDGSRI